MLQTIPLAERLRPKNLQMYVGQSHLVGDGKVLKKMIENENLISMIFWGPPGVGKTTLAQILAQSVSIPFVSISAVSSGIKDVKEVIEQAKKSGKIVLFIDEIHRFNKTQQDSLLGAVEKGYLILIGATTENPSFEIIHALLSRCQVFVLQELIEEELLKLLGNALNEDLYLASKNISIVEYAALLHFSGGDARKLLNLLELVVELSSENTIKITDDLVTNIVQKNMIRFDKNGEMHYDLISAFIKSIRGSDPNAALYYLARIIEGGEDPKFIARRMVILASEDIGNANPNALLLATACFQAVTMIGLPECSINLAHVATYLATSPKSNASYVGLMDAYKVVRETGDLSIPLTIRNAPTKLMKNLDYGKNYKYAHDHPGSFISMEFLPDKIKETTFYSPGNNPRENEIRKFLKDKWGSKYHY